MTDEEYVRARWEVHTAFPNGNGKYYLALAPDKCLDGEFDGQFDTEAEAWSAARAFTENREREIAEVEEEIALIANLGSHVKQEAFAVDIRKRILSREQAVLAELRRGMKEGSE